MVLGIEKAKAKAKAKYHVIQLSLFEKYRRRHASERG
jgi:hypothetical protein